MVLTVGVLNAPPAFIATLNARLGTDYRFQSGVRRGTALASAKRQRAALVSGFSRGVVVCFHRLTSLPTLFSCTLVPAPPLARSLV